MASRAPMVVALAAWTLWGTAAWAQGSGGTPALKLRATPMLAETVARDGATPLFASGDRMTGRDQLDTVIEGNAQLRRPGQTLRADRITYDEATDLATAQGDVRINSHGNRYSGSEGAVKVHTMRGFVLRPTYQILLNGGHGQGERIDFIDPDRASLSNADYTTCRRPMPSSEQSQGQEQNQSKSQEQSRGQGWTPDWVLRARRLDLDHEAGEGHIEGGKLEFKGVPLIPIPSMTFPLTERRQSGWLPPTIGMDTTSGLSLAVPYYWNIAPNRDATLIPKAMSKRGVDLGGQFRYLEKDYSGIVEANLLPADMVRHRTRWGFFDRHNGTFDTGIDSLGRVGLNLNINRVSDNDYWVDFPRSGRSLTPRLLTNDASLSWSRGDFAMQARTLKWQVLTDKNNSSSDPPPYDRSPQLTGRWTHGDGWGGLDYAVETDYTRFSRSPLSQKTPGDPTGDPNGEREYVQAQLARPFQRPWGFFTPAARLHASHYSFDSPLSVGSSRSLGRAIPTLSLDSGLIFERDASYLGRAFRQTLEPRLKYVYTPYRNQSMIPNYDSGPYDFNFATIWADNAFVGHDRIADNNLLTFGLTSRLLDPATGAEAVRLGIAQRYRFAAQQVTLPGGTPSGTGVSDMMLGASVNWDRHWGGDSVLQYDPNKNQSTRTTLGLRYLPDEYRTLSMAYRRARDLGTRQLDIGWQWPLWGQDARRWYSVGRVNYDLAGHKPVDAVLGVEYDAGCWVGRFVFSRLQTSTGTANTGIMFQVDFIGLASVGFNNPLRTLRENIPNYHLLRQETVPPSRFSTYD